LEKRYLSMNDASEYLSLSRITLHRLVKAGTMPSYKVGKKRLFDKQELDKWMQTKKDKPKSTRERG
jgi:excisionase family DNA binding protein